MRAILMYHAVDDSDSPISVSEEVFKAHVRFLASGRVRVVPLEALRSQPDENDAVAITFDDGFESFEHRALPLLASHGLPATVFVVTERVGKTNAWGGVPDPGIPTLPLMDWPALERACRRGVAIGAHTRRHPDLTTLAPDELEAEVAGSAEDVVRTLGQRPTVFAYPYGSHDGRVSDVVRRHFALACTTELRVLEGGEDPARLPRLDAFYFRTTGQLEAWGTAAFRRRVWLRARGRQVRRLIRTGGRP
jgi:peptidoglycan/xylan/chitin deacetylase (PgdA/CDA1 family)